MRLIFALAALAMMASAEFRVGVAQVDITPPLGTPMAGYYSNRPAKGTHDPLHAKAMVIEREGVRIAMVSCDLLSMPGHIAKKARTLIQERLQIPASHVMVSATHTHMGPVLIGGQLRYNLDGEMLRLAEVYTQTLPEKLFEAVKAAADQTQPATLYLARGHEDSLTFNRRFWMEDGSVGWNPGKKNPKIVREAGPIDAEVPVLYVESAVGKPLGVYVNYALHLDTVGGAQYTADYPYALSKALAAAKGDSLITLFTLGAAGNLNHVNVRSSLPQSGHGEAARIGTVLAAAVLKALGTMEEVPDGPLAASTRMAKLETSPFTQEELTAAKADAVTFGRKDQAPFLRLVKAGRILAIAAENGQPISAEVQVLSVGLSVAWVSLPGEVFTELGLAIKLGSPFTWTSVVTQANESFGYIPDRKAHAQGAYEAVSSRFAPGSGEKLVETATVALVEHLQKAQ